MQKISLTQWFFSHESGVWHRRFLDSENMTFDNKIICSVMYVKKTDKYHGFVFLKTI